MSQVQLLAHSENYTNPLIKPVELYIFIDPLCKQGFILQSIIRRLQLQYDHYFTYRFVLSTDLTSLNCYSNHMKDCTDHFSLDISHPVLPSIAVKAAELQGGCPVKERGKLIRYTGGFCIVFPYEESGHKYAVRCW